MSCDVLFLMIYVSAEDTYVTPAGSVTYLLPYPVYRPQ